MSAVEIKSLFGVKRGQGHEGQGTLAYYSGEVAAAAPVTLNCKQSSFSERDEFTIGRGSLTPSEPSCLLTHITEGEKGRSLNQAAGRVFQLQHRRHLRVGTSLRGENMAPLRPQYCVSLYTWMDFISLRHALPRPRSGERKEGKKGGRRACRHMLRPAAGPAAGRRSAVASGVGSPLSKCK